MEVADAGPEADQQLGVMACNLGSEPDHVLEVPDRFADLAVLLRDNTEQMLGFIRVRRYREHAAANLVGVRQTAAAAIALGQCQRGGQRSWFTRHLPLHSIVDGGVGAAHRHERL
jgi:hypothetical protein